MLTVRKLDGSRRTPRTNTQTKKEIAKEEKEKAVKISPGGSTGGSGGSTGGAVVPVVGGSTGEQNSGRTKRDLGGNFARKSSNSSGNWQFQGWGTPRSIDHTLEHQIYGTKPQETQQNERSIQRKFGAIFW
jgi:hypothetical protein